MRADGSRVGVGTLELGLVWKEIRHGFEKSHINVIQLVLLHPQGSRPAHLLRYAQSLDGVPNWL